METLLELLKMLVKGALLLVGGLLLFGGGACALFGIGSIGSGGAGLLYVVGIAIVVALVGWGIVQLALAIGRTNSKSVMPKKNLKE